MLAQPVNSQSHNHTNETGRSVTAVAIILGLLLGGMFNFFWAGLPWLVILAMWPLGIAIGLVALASHRLRGEAQWGMALAGQAIGVVAIALIFVASMI